MNTIALTGNKQVDLLILSKMKNDHFDFDGNLLKFFAIKNRYIRQLSNDENFWRNRFFTNKVLKFNPFMKDGSVSTELLKLEFVPRSWKKFYLGLLYIVKKGYENRTYFGNFVGKVKNPDVTAYVEFIDYCRRSMWDPRVKKPKYSGSDSMGLNSTDKTLQNAIFKPISFNQWAEENVDRSNAPEFFKPGGNEEYPIQTQCIDCKNDIVFIKSCSPNNFRIECSHCHISIGFLQCHKCNGQKNVPCFECENTNYIKISCF